MPISIVYTQLGKVLYHVGSPSCPELRLLKAGSLIRPHSIGCDKIHEHDLDVAVRHGIDPMEHITVAAETLFQEQGYAKTLMIFEPEEDED